MALLISWSTSYLKGRSMMRLMISLNWDPLQMPLLRLHEQVISFQQQVK